MAVQLQDIIQDFSSVGKYLMLALRQLWQFDFKAYSSAVWVIATKPLNYVMGGIPICQSLPNLFAVNIYLDLNYRLVCITCKPHQKQMNKKSWMALCIVWLQGPPSAVGIQPKKHQNTHVAHHLFNDWFQHARWVYNAVAGNGSYLPVQHVQLMPQRL